MNVICYPSTLNGSVSAISSKSDAHRKLICTALSENGGVLPLFPPFCDDVAATIWCLKALGADFTQTEAGLRITPVKPKESADLDCGESGSTLRFLLPVAAAVCDKIAVTGSGRLPNRPISALTQEMSAHGVQFSGKQLPFRTSGRIAGGIYEIPGNISSQFLSGLLMALPLCGEDSEIRLSTELQSSAYVDMTLETLREYGAEISVFSDESGLLRYKIKHGSLRTPPNTMIDGDWSNAAFWLVAGSIQKDKNAAVSVSGLDSDSVQGDSEIWSILEKSGAATYSEKREFSVKSSVINPLRISMEGIPDLLPILAVMAANSESGDYCSEFANAARLRLKESDRLAATYALLQALGGRVQEYADRLSVFGGQLHGGTINGMNDHRLVMAAAVAAISAESSVKIIGAEAVNKSYPSFFQDYISLGGKIAFQDEKDPDILLIPANLCDAERIWTMQRRSFSEQYAVYQDHETNPAAEPVCKVQYRLNQPETYYYIITANGADVGAIRIVDRRDGTPKRISPLFVLPEMRRKGYAESAVRIAEALHGADGWTLSTVLQETGNCLFYEKIGYRRTGAPQKLDDRMTLVNYVK